MEECVNMYRRGLIILAGTYLFFYILNCLMPLAFGDDYLYAFFWQGNPMFVPLPENAVRISSWNDLLGSQLSFYFTWSGRIVNNTLSQLFIWVGKSVFNVCNAAISTLLVLEIFWCVNKGKVSFHVDAGMICWIFFTLWTFTPSYPPVFFWLVGSIHYLWTAALVLGFLVPYIQNYYSLQMKLKGKSWFCYFMFFTGILAGCTNENSVCILIIVLSLFIFVQNKKQKEEIWMYFGLAGLFLGYTILMFAPGNYARLISVHGSEWFNKETLLNNLQACSKALIWQFVLWYYCLRSLHKLKKSKNYYADIEKKLKKDILLAKTFCILAMGMTFVMLLSPEFHLRSAFPGTIQLIIATGIVIRVQQEYKIELLPRHVKKFLTCIGIIYFSITTVVSVHYIYEHYIWTESITDSVKVLQTNGMSHNTILYIKPLRAKEKIVDLLSGYHTFDNNLSEDVSSWENVAFARYYNIKGICVCKEEDSVSEKNQ